MDYLAWNDLLAKHYFDSSMAGREVLLYVNEEIIKQLGEPYGAGVWELIEAVKKGPDWATKPELCQRALQAYDKWRERGIEYPPYVAYLVFFVLAAVTETDYAPHSYYPGLRKLLGEPQDLGMPSHFSSMIVLWDDLEKWSREDKHEELGRFVARIRGGWIYVGLPRSQTILSEKERKHLPNIFYKAGLDPTDLPSPEIIPQILSYYGDTVLENRTKVLLKGGSTEDAVSKNLKKALVDLVLEELEEWDGTVLKQGTEEGGEAVPIQQIHTSLRLCIKIDPMASHADIHVRFKTSRPFPEEGLIFSRPGDASEWQCHESHRGWSTLLKENRNYPQEKLNGAIFDWANGERLADTESHWRARLHGAEVRLFRLGIDGLPNWIETHRLERGIKFLVACTSSYAERITSWINNCCERFDQLHVSGLPNGWMLFQGENASESCPEIDILTLSTTVRLLLEEGIKAGKGNVYFNFAPPKIVMQNRQGSEEVTVNGKKIEPEEGQMNEFALPEDVPSGLPIRIEARVGDHCLSKVIRLAEFGLPDSFDDTPHRDSKGNIITGEFQVSACGAHATGIKNLAYYQGPKLTLLSKKVIFIGEKPGEVAEWPDEPVPKAWKPVWAAAKRRRNQWELYFCGTVEQIKRISELPTPTGNRSQIKNWKKVIWYRRKRYALPEIIEIREIWNDYLRLAQHV